MSNNTYIRKCAPQGLPIGSVEYAGSPRIGPERFRAKAQLVFSVKSQIGPNCLELTKIKVHLLCSLFEHIREYSDTIHQKELEKSFSGSVYSRF